MARPFTPPLLMARPLREELNFFVRLPLHSCIFICFAPNSEQHLIYFPFQLPTWKKYIYKHTEQHILQGN